MSAKRFIGLILAIALLPSAFVMAVNSTYDPHWYFNGNLWGARSYFFENGRDEKLRVFRKNNGDKKYSCLLLGSSRFLTIRTDELPEQGCFNFSVSSGNFYDMISIGKFAREQGNHFSTVYVGVDDWHFETERDDSCHKFAKRGVAPAASESQPRSSLLNKYLSAKSLFFAWRIENHHNVWIGYDRNFEPLMRPGAYDLNSAQISMKNSLYFLRNPGKLPPKNYADNCSETLLKVLELFPEAEKIGIHTPVKSYLVLEKSLQGKLEDYESIIWKISRYFDRFYDPMIDLDYSTVDEGSWDGTHFYPEFWSRYLKSPNRMDVRKMELDEYRRAVAARFDPYRASVDKAAESTQ